MPKVTGDKNYGKTPNIKSRSNPIASKSGGTYNSKRHGSPTNTNTPGGGGGFGLSTSQSAGRTKRARPTGMNVAGPDGDLSGMPNVHSANNTGGPKVGRDSGTHDMSPGKKITQGHRMIGSYSQGKSKVTKN